MRTWIKVTASLAESPEDWGAWIDVFDQFGMASTEQTDRPPSLSGYYAGDHPIDLRGFQLRLNHLADASVTTLEVAEEEWAESWKQFFKPRRVGKHWMIKPSWEDCGAEPGDRVIELDPGQAFGTGDHPTTRMCLELLERQDLQGAMVADIGCGSGILSIAALLVGAARAVAVDVDPIAVEASIENAARNQVALDAVVGDGFAAVSSKAPFDIVLANIISATLINVAHQAATALKPGGVWIVSGIIDENWTDVQRAAQQVGFGLVEVLTEDRWVAATFRR
ncbi:MAG: Ribosomal protein L11 methyltransferase [Fimbriimonadaceae bacterium]|nr:Ribosomal protein L11 methyltransferase [Fimbriimonadaceae bacterium]